MTNNINDIEAYEIDVEKLMWLVFGDDDEGFEDFDLSKHLPDPDPFCMPALSVGDYDTAEYEKQFN